MACFSRRNYRRLLHQSSRSCTTTITYFSSQVAPRAKEMLQVPNSAPSIGERLREQLPQPKHVFEIMMNNDSILFSLAE
jgi:hypothetical protein